MEINKYQQGKIYKITDNAYIKTYYGSTTQALSSRMTCHRSLYKNGKGKMTSFNIFEEFGVENCKIELVELYPCNSKNELEMREGFYIKNNICVNKKIAGRTKEEYKEDNKEKIALQMKEYYEDNKDKIILQNKEYYKDNKEKIALQNKEYYEDNKEKIVLQNKEYYEDNKEKIVLQKNEKHQCECGGKYTQVNQLRHFKTEKHQSFINSLL